MMNRTIGLLHDHECRMINNEFNLQQGRWMFRRPSQLYEKVGTTKGNGEAT